MSQMKEFTEYLDVIKFWGKQHLLYACGKRGDDFLSFLRDLSNEGTVAGKTVKRFLGENCKILDKKQLMQLDADMDEFIQKGKEAGDFYPLEYLLDTFLTNEKERHCIRFLICMEIVPEYTTIVQILQDSYDRAEMSMELFMDTYAGESTLSGWNQIFSDSSTLMRFFVNVSNTEEYYLKQSFRIDKRILKFVLEDYSYATELREYVQYWRYGDTLPEWIGDGKNEAEQWMRMETAHSLQTLYVYGEEGSGRKLLVKTAAEKHKRNLGFVFPDEIAEGLENWDYRQYKRWIDGVLRELVIYNVMPVFVFEEQNKELLKKKIHKLNGLWKELSLFFRRVILIAETKILLPADMHACYVCRNAMNLIESRNFWEKKASDYAIEGEAGSMANRFHLTPGQIIRVLENAESERRKKGSDSIPLSVLSEQCYEVLDQQMGKRTIWVPAHYKMSDLILPEKQKRQLDEICNQVIYKDKVYEQWGFEEKMAYGKGISMAFIGTAGTGKTMAAQVIAGRLQMRLYKVNLSSVVSKYVGETEKNLDEIFEAAAKGQVILFFDEADVLFGKRTEGKEANDKYSNMEAAFLLQRMENYNGITILATNLFQHFDEAFKRRLKTVVEFPVPNAEQRKQLWMSMIPPKMPVGEIDFDYLAETFELTGSNIRNILLHASFLAAAKEKEIGMEELIPAIRNEYAKLGKTLLKSDVSEYYIFLDN